MPLIPFSARYSDEFLSRTEDNFDVFLEKLKLFYDKTREEYSGPQKLDRLICLLHAT